MRNFSSSRLGAFKLKENIINSVEALLFGSGRPMRLSEIKNILQNTGLDVELSDIKRSINKLEIRYEKTSLEIKEVASGFRLNINENYSSSLSLLWNEKAPRVSRALMETVSIIAYKQPVTRGDIEDIRGITVSTRIIRSLMEKNWIKVSGYRDVPGRPSLFITTKDFLNDLNLKSISELPELPESEETEEKDLLSQAV